jgi:hypothetical protein
MLPSESEGSLSTIGRSENPGAAVYNRHAYMEEMREALRAWERKLAALGTAPPS